MLNNKDIENKIIKIFIEEDVTEMDAVILSDIFFFGKENLLVSDRLKYKKRAEFFNYFYSIINNEIMVHMGTTYDEGYNGIILLTRKGIRKMKIMSLNID